MLTIWGRRTSSNVQAVMWCIAELDLPYDRIDIGHRFGGNDTPEFLAMNPNGKIPVIRDGDGPPIWETGAILRYLSSVYAPDAFWPDDPVARSQVDRWAEWAKLNVAVGFTVPIFWSVVRTPAAERDWPQIAQAVGRLAEVLAVAEHQLSEHAFLAGPDFTLADIQLGHLLYRYFDIEIERPDLPALRAYYDRLKERAAFAEHVMISYDELRA
ncbi:MAG: glutathione S-transferase family protein [Rhodobacteraceae bacterium]|nr:glutathione S-transferase family protein [Paracoccaceae bacterium]